jgi:hypothetical protein
MGSTASDARGMPESISGALDAMDVVRPTPTPKGASIVKMSVAKIEDLGRENVMVAQQAAKMLNITKDRTICHPPLRPEHYSPTAEMLIKLAARAGSTSTITGPVITAGQARRAHIHCDANYMAAEETLNVMKALMKMESMDVFGQQKAYENCGGRHPYEPPEASAACDLVRKTINFTLGVWGDTPTVVGWPHGVLKIQKSALGGDHLGLADLIEVFAELAVAVLKSTMGRIRYLMGLPLTKNTMRHTSLNVTGSFLTKEFFFIPLTSIPFLLDILRIPWEGANNEFTNALIDKNAATNMKMVKNLRDGTWPSSLSDTFKFLRPYDVVAHNPVIEEQPPGSLPLPSRQWRHEAAHCVEIEVVAMEIRNVPNVPEVPEIPLAALPDETPLSMDNTEPAETLGPETLDFISGYPSAATSADLLLQVVSGAPVRTGGDTNMDVDPSANEAALRCAAAWNE